MDSSSSFSIFQLKISTKNPIKTNRIVKNIINGINGFKINIANVPTAFNAFFFAVFLITRIIFFYGVKNIMCCI